MVGLVLQEASEDITICDTNDQGIDDRGGLTFTSSSSVMSAEVSSINQSTRAHQAALIRESAARFLGSEFSQVAVEELLD